MLHCRFVSNSREMKIFRSHYIGRSKFPDHSPSTTVVFPQIMEAILDKFREIGVEINPDWIAGLELCNEGPISDDDVYMALMTSDLRSACISSSGSPIRSVKLRGMTAFPPGSFLFQITNSVDISIPDSQRPRNNTVDTTSRRMLKFKLHASNSAELDAVELEPIPGLPDNPEAGKKIIVHGSPLLRNMLLLLRPENVKLVGGEVENLCLAQKKDNEERIRMRDPLACRRVLAETQNSR